MSTFNNHLQTIHQQISIKDEDRQPYTEMYNTITKWLMDEMCNVDPVFRDMYKGLELFGSYPNRVRIIEPNEYDVFILLKFPFDLRLKTHLERPGFIKIYTKKYKKLKNIPFELIYKDMFMKKDGSHGAFHRARFQRWIEGIITEVLSKSPPVGYSVTFNSCSVAQNLRVVENGRGNCKKISIDFVPAIVLHEDYMRRLIKEEDDIEYLKTFVAIPKRLRACGPKNSRKYTFQLVNPVAERDIIWDKQNLKVVYRLLKSFRNRYPLRRLKSYFLTAIFLREVDSVPDDFWRQSIDVIFLHMLKKLLDYFEKRNLPYYWVPGFNLLSILKPNEITEYKNILRSSYMELEEISVKNFVSLSEVKQFFKTTK